MKKLVALGAALFLGPLLATAHEEAAMPPDHGMIAPEDIQWQAGPPALPAGAKIAVLEGSPAQEGLFTMRAWAPAGYQIPPHWHAAFEHVTVISGTAGLGMGDVFDKAAGQTLPAGGFAYMAPGKHHFFWAESEVVIQIHAMGPWQLYYVNPADDPRAAMQP
ncbi:MAG: cupin domain-containing protein [Thermoanaerobaculia bacterium]